MPASRSAGQQRAVVHPQDREIGTRVELVVQRVRVAQEREVPLDVNLGEGARVERLP